MTRPGPDETGRGPRQTQGLAERLGMGRQHAAERIGDLNDGIIGTAGIVEGFAGAGLGGTAVLLAAVSGLIAGSIATGGAKYAEAAAELEVQAALRDEAARVQRLSPREGRDELTQTYRGMGLSEELAGQVAEQLQSRDVPAGHAAVAPDPAPASLRPAVAAGGGGLAFIAGGLLPLLIVAVTPLSLDGLITYAAVLVSLLISAVVLTRVGRSNLWHNVRRSLVIGVLTMSTAWLAGHLFT
ncbi:VIT1/CCC1 transporter family protein [Intrasporangium sp.]|uniref:VIT1/CCC1 transporter family protein n=1 Tax=Intrasporangium sp. TaxID=1925024 RepID=UPI003221CBD5